MEKINENILFSEAGAIKLRLSFRKIRKESDSIKVAGTENILLDLKENFNKGKFRKCLDDMAEKETAFGHYLEKWRISELKIRCMLKIINKKFAKYSGREIKGLDNWLRRVDDEIMKLIDFMNEEQSHGSSSQLLYIFEACIKFVLEQIYHYALKARNEYHMVDCTSFLALGERLLKYSTEFTLDPDSLYISEKILLFISSLLIADSDYETAKSYLANTLRLCYRELEMKYDWDGSINIKAIPQEDEIFLENIMLNFVTALYQVGVCEENLSNIIKAVEAYKQSKWFADNFLQKSNPELIEFINKVLIRSTQYCHLIKNIKLYGSDYREKKRSEIIENSPQIYFDELKAIRKFDKTKNFVEQLKPTIIEDDNKKYSEEVKSILSTVHMVDYLLSDPFKDILKEMKAINLNYMDKDEKEKIQKKLNEINSLRIYNENKNFRNSISKPNLASKKSFVLYKNKFNPNKTFNSENRSENRDFSLSMTKNNWLTTSYETKNFGQNCNNNLLSSQNYFNTSPNLSNKRKGIQSARNKINATPKYQFSEAIFSKSYKAKKDFLDRYADKEYNFQKKLLKLKKCEKLNVDPFDKIKLKQYYETFFNNEYKNKTKIISEEENKEKIKENLNKEMIKKRQKEKLKTKVIKSLNTNVFNEYEKLKKELKKEAYTSKKETNLNREICDNKNLAYLDMLDGKLLKLSNFEHSLNQKLRPTSMTKRTTLKKPYFKINKSLDEFVSH
jgi:hypothetical protein